MYFYISFFIVCSGGKDLYLGVTFKVREITWPVGAVVYKAFRLQVESLEVYHWV